MPGSGHLHRWMRASRIWQLMNRIEFGGGQGLSRRIDPDDAIARPLQQHRSGIRVRFEPDRPVGIEQAVDRFQDRFMRWQFDDSAFAGIPGDIARSRHDGGPRNVTHRTNRFPAAIRCAIHDGLSPFR